MLGIVKPLDTLILPQMDAFFIHLTEKNNIYGAFAKEITADEEPIFYELDIEKYLNTFAAIGAAGATSEDSTLPMLIKYSSEEFIIISVINGVLCSVAVPILINFFFSTL